MASLVAAAASVTLASVAHGDSRTVFENYRWWTGHDGAALSVAVGGANGSRDIGPQPTTLTVIDQGAASPRTLGVINTVQVRDQAVGTDLAGRPVALLLSSGEPGAFMVPFDGPPSPVPVSGKGITAVAMHQGRVAIAKRSRGRERVYVRNVAGGRSREVLVLPKDWSATELAIGRGDVVFTRGTKIVGLDGRTDDREIIWRSDASGHARRLLTRHTGSYRGLGPGTITGDGTRFNISKWSVIAPAGNRLWTYSVATGRLLVRRPAPAIGAPRSVTEVALDSTRTLLNSAGPFDPDRCTERPACLGTTLVVR